MYGPTVVTTTLVCSASCLSDGGSVTSASMIGMSVRPMSSSVFSSLSLLRPATAHCVVGGACSARYWAVSAPVNPVAPNTTMSCSRSAILRDLVGCLECRRQVLICVRGYPAGGGRCDALRGMGRLRCEVEDRLELVLGRRVRAELFGEGVEPVGGVHVGACRTLSGPRTLAPAKRSTRATRSRQNADARIEINERKASPDGNTRRQGGD